MEHSFMAADKREREKQVVALMISLYCRKKHHTLKGRLCPECEALLSYAHLRSVHLWRPRRFAVIVRFIVTNQKCGKRSGK